MKKTLIIAFLAVLIPMVNTSCTEPYALQTNNFEDAIVVEATITNEFKKQEIKLSRTYRFEENGPKFETAAIVYVIDDLGNRYDFEENNDKYTSISAFQAIANRNYQLYITTNNGKSYTSSNEKLTTVNEIQDLTTSVTTKEGIRGVEIKVNSFDPSNTSKYYRYEYDETYKIIAPKWIPQELIVTGAYSSVLIPRTIEAKTCYGVFKSRNIIITNTNNQANDIIEFPIRFISTQNYIISHRYSILLRQYIENLNAYNYYSALKKISSSESILSQNQPGLIAGNLKSLTNINEKIIGFFDVCSVSEKRIFFNYSDLFPGEALPPYYTNCDDHIFKYCFAAADPECQGWSVLGAIESKTDVLHYIDYPNYHLVFSPCGDCNTLGSNIKPIFWID